MILILKDGPFRIEARSKDLEIVGMTAQIKGEMRHVADVFRFKGINFDGRPVTAEIRIEVE